jgi:hypothetical protein
MATVGWSLRPLPRNQAGHMTASRGNVQNRLPIGAVL